MNSLFIIANIYFINILASVSSMGRLCLKISGTILHSFISGHKINDK